MGHIRFMCGIVTLTCLLEVLLKSLADLLLVKGSAAVSNEASEAAGPSVAPASEAPAAPAAPQEPAKARGLSTASRREQWMLDDNAAGNMSSNICQTYLLLANRSWQFLAR